MSVTYTLQLLHMSDAEAGLLASRTAPIMAALIDRFEDQYSNSITLSGGDNFLPGPFLAAGTDSTINAVLGTTGTPAFARPDYAILNAMGIEVSAIGNHEFDLGSNVFADAIRPVAGSNWGGALFPHISANLVFSGDAALNPLFTNTVATPGLEEASTLRGRIAPSTVITEGGERIGFVGATTQILQTISSPTGTTVLGAPGRDDMDLLAAQLQPVIDDLRAQGVNKIVVMSHLQQLSNERLLATKLEGVDIILGAGSNTRLGDTTDVPAAFPGHSPNFADTYPIVTQGKDGGTTLIVNTDNEFTYLGRLVVGFDSQGRVDLTSLNPTINGAYASTNANLQAAYGTATVAEAEAIAFADGTRGDRVRDITTAVQQVINAKDGNIFGFTSVYLEGERGFVRSEETNLGNLTADANLASLDKALGVADTSFMVSLKNGGGIRAQIGTIVPGGAEKLPPQANPDIGKPTGGVSQLDVENSLRFDNRLMALDLTLAELLQVLDHGVALWPNQGRFPQLGGVRFSWDPLAPAGQRVRDVALEDGEGNLLREIVNDRVIAADAPARITVVTLNFLANGGDGYPLKTLGENFRFLLNDGTLGPAVSPTANFTAPGVVPANSLGEQQALREFMQANHATAATAYNKADTIAALDNRIQRTDVRADNVLDGVVRFGDGSGAAITGTVSSDTLTGSDAAETIDGGASDDVISGGGGADRLFGGAGNDRISFGAEDTVVNGGTGFDTGYITSSAGATIDMGVASLERLFGGAGNDVISTTGVTQLEIDGAGGDDTISGSAFGDRIAGGSGNDSIRGLAGNDVLAGGSGNDTIEGGAGVDIMRGEAGDDTIVYSVEDAFIDGGAGRDTARAGGNEGLTIRMDAWNVERLVAGSGGDRVFTFGVSEVFIDGGAGNDDLSGNAFGDTLLGGDGNDVLQGLGGNDSLDGGAGADRLIGGPGADTLTGGAGADTYVFTGIGLADTITTFEAGVDRIEIARAGFDLSLATGTMAANRLVIGSGTVVANQAFGQFLFDISTGNLFWDGNGSAAGGATLLADLPNMANNTISPLTAADFFIV